MFPEDVVRRVTQWTRFDAKLIHYMVDIGNGGITQRRQFEGYSLAEAMQQVREWATTRMAEPEKE